MPNKKNLLIYAHYYIPDTASTWQILRELEEGMLDKFNITVICVVPSYLGIIEDKYKTQKYYEEEINGVKVLRIQVPEFSKTNKKSRVKNIVSYFFGAMGATFKVGKMDYVFSISQPPILGGLLGVWGKWVKHAKFIYNIQDFNPEQVLAVGYIKSKFITDAMMWFDKFSCKRSDLIITVGREVVFAFVGAGSVLDKLVLYVKKHHMDNVKFIPYQDKADLIYSLNAGDVHWCVNTKGIKGVSCPSNVYPKVYAVDIVPEKVELINNRKSPIQDEYIEKYLAEKELDLTATLDAESAYSTADFVVIAAPTNYDSVTQHFNTTAVENVIELVMKANPNAIMVIKSTVPVGYTVSVREKYNCKNIIFSPEFLRESKALYDNVYPKFSVDFS